jgi:tetratricopeptide (TPR) repeat protein
MSEMILKAIDEKNLEYSMAVESNEANILILSAEYFEQVGRVNEAIDIYNHAIIHGDDKSKAEVYNRLAGLYFIAMQDIASSIDCSQKAITIYKELAEYSPLEYNKPLVELLNNLSSIKFQMNDKEYALNCALESFDLMLYLIPTDYEKYIQLFDQTTQNAISIANSLHENEDQKYLFAKSIEILRDISDTNNQAQKKLNEYTKQLEKVEKKL